MTHLYTIGHSRRSSEEFIELLHQYEIQLIVDVRRWPSSRRYPHFNREQLSKSLRDCGISYEWLGEQLGGYRGEGLRDASPNKAWQSEGFRNYADYTMTEQFRDGMSRLLNLAEMHKLAIMCAEQLYWRCHRRIISDYLKIKGHVITHIISSGKTEEHQLTRFARDLNGELRYPKTEGHLRDSMGL